MLRGKIYVLNKKRPPKQAVRQEFFMQFYQRLKDMREDHDMTQAQIAEILGTVRQQYARWENGAQELPMHHFITLAKYYNVSLDYLAGLIDFPRELHERLKKTGVTFYKN